MQLAYKCLKTLGHSVKGCLNGFILTDVALAKQLHSHHSEDEDDDAENEGQVS